jgi:DNA-binding NtrC family response regulator
VGAAVVLDPPALGGQEAVRHAVMASSDPGPASVQPKILIVHPENGVRALLVRTLSASGYEPVAATSGEEAIELSGLREIRVVLLELDLAGLSGLETLRALRAMAPAPEVVVTAGRGSTDAVARATEYGACDFVPQPFDLAQLREALRAAWERACRPAPRAGPEGVDTHAPELVGQSAAMARVLTLIHKAAATDFAVLIQGESGTGKELVARAIHAHSPRARVPLTIVDCGALQDTLLESELFGHERGAFTGAHGMKHGLFETANHGTVFLDEIGEMSPIMQVKVLRALQSGEFRRVGSNRLIRSDMRVIAATNRDLRSEVQRGRFREDLYYRLAVIEIHMPPLRERPQDISVLAAHFLRRRARGGFPGVRLTAEAMACLQAYSWPGNVRELRNCIERVVALADTPNVTVESLPPSILATSARGPLEAGVDLPLEEVERRHILRTLERHHWNRARAAEVLGIDAKTLYNKLRRYRALGPLGDATVPPAPGTGEPGLPESGL